MRGRHAKILAVMAAAIVCLGCGVRAYEWPADAMPVYTQSIPVYPKSTFDSAMGGDYYGDDGGKVSETLTWWFDSPSTQDEIAEWYASRLPQARRDRGEDGEVVFTYQAEGAAQGEEIVVRIEQKRFRITEETKPGKHKDA